MKRRTKRALVCVAAGWLVSQALAALHDGLDHVEDAQQSIRSHAGELKDRPMAVEEAMAADGWHLVIDTEGFAAWVRRGDPADVVDVDEVFDVDRS